MSNQTFVQYSVGQDSFFDVNARCNKLGVPEKCRIDLDKDSKIISLGPWQRGTFEPRADIAGPGILWANFVTSLLLLLGGIVAVCRNYRKWRRDGNGLKMHYPTAKERRDRHKILYEAFRTYLLATSDANTLLSLAYGLNFFLVQQCTISDYHYTVVTDIVLMSCANFVLITALVSEYWRAPLTGFLRLGAMAVVFAFLGKTLNYHRTRVSKPEYIPPKSRNDSVILLPASCFLDPQFKNLTSNLTASTLEKIGYQLKPYRFWEFRLWIVLVVAFGVGVVRTIIQFFVDRRNQAKTCNLWTGLIISCHKIVALGLFMSVSIMAWYRILRLKSWVDSSHWIKPGRKPNPENDMLENGQILPLLQLGIILVFICNEFDREAFSTSPTSPKSSLQPQTLESQTQPLVSGDTGIRSARGVGSPRQSGSESPVSQALNPPVNQTRNYSVSQTLDPPVSQTLNFPVSQALDSPVSQTLDPPVSQTLDPPVSQTLDSPVSQTLDSPVSQAVDLPVSQALNPPVSQPSPPPRQSGSGSPRQLGSESPISQALNPPVSQTLRARMVTKGLD